MIKKFVLTIMFLSFFTNLSANYHKLAYDFNFKSIDGNEIKLSNYKEKVIVIVNVASRCGYTPQYANLQNLFLEYKDSDLTIIATTSNSFYQEYDEVEDIKKICLVNYGVGFVTSAPMEVKGTNTHPLYAWINEKYNKKIKIEAFEKDWKLFALIGLTNISIPYDALISSVVIFVVIPFAAGYIVNKILIKSHGEKWFKEVFLAKLKPVSIYQPRDFLDKEI